MMYHILNGDCLAEQLRQTKINQDFVICRECLIEGDLIADNMADFWKLRARFIADTFTISMEDYLRKSKAEFEKLNSIPENSEVCLWFENDLFCQTNMWFVISMLSNHKKIKIYRVFPIVKSSADFWNGFGISDAEELEQAYFSKVQFTKNDLKLGRELWIAYQNSDFSKLGELARSQSKCFECLEEVCRAHIDRFPKDGTLGRPDRVIKEILETVSTEFETVFAEFSIREGIYGFGDVQLKRIYDRQMQSGKHA